MAALLAVYGERAVFVDGRIDERLTQQAVESGNVKGFFNGLFRHRPQPIAGMVIRLKQGRSLSERPRQTTHGSTMSIPKPSKSLVLLVARVKS